jgi:hypothetical protein
MTKQYLLPKARCPQTGQTVKEQDLTGYRYTNSERAFAQEKADQLAAKLAVRTGQTWQGFVEVYTPTHRR